MSYNKGWIRLPEQLLRDKSVSITSAVVYAVMLDKAGPDMNVKITQSKVAELAGISRRTAIRAMQELSADGWIVPHRTQKDGDTLIYHLYEVIPYKYHKGEQEK